MENKINYKLQTFFIATIVAIILSGCATRSDYNTDRADNTKAHYYKMHNYTFDN